VIKPTTGCHIAAGFDSGTGVNVVLPVRPSGLEAT